MENDDDLPNIDRFDYPVVSPDPDPPDPDPPEVQQDEPRTEEMATGKSNIV